MTLLETVGGLSDEDFMTPLLCPVFRHGYCQQAYRWLEGDLKQNGSVSNLNVIDLTSAVPYSTFGSMQDQQRYHAVGGAHEDRHGQQRLAPYLHPALETTEKSMPNHRYLVHCECPIPNQSSGHISFRRASFIG